MGGVALLSRKPAISLKRGKIGPMLLLVTNGKLHTCYQLIPKSVTLDDLERPFCTLFKIRAFSEPTTQISAKIHLYCLWQRCSTMTVISGSIRFMQIFARGRWRWGLKRQWGNRKRRFSVLSDAVFGTLRPTLLCSII